jgi:O-antigen/teichoic acid export membrane protein
VTGEARDSSGPAVDRRSRTGDRLRLAKDILAAGLRHASSIVAGILTVALVARVLGPDALGAWAMMATMGLLMSLCDLGLTTAVHRAAVAGDPGTTRRMVGLALLATVILSPIAALGSYAFLRDIPGASPELLADASRALVLVLAGGVTGALAAPYRAFVVVRGGMQALARARALAALLQVIVTAVGLSLSSSLLAPALGMLLGLSVEGALTLRAALAIDRELPRRPLLPASGAELATALRDGSASLAINLAGAAAIRIDVFILARVAPLAVVAAYGVASRAVDQSYVLAKQASAALLPRLGDPKQRDRATDLGTAVLGGLGASGLVALALCGTPLLVAWAGPVAAAPPATIALSLLALAAVVMASVEVASSTVTLGARTAWSAAIPIVLGAAVNVLISVTGASSLGVWAVAGGTLVGNLLLAVLMWRGARSLLGWSGARVARTLAPVAAAGLAALASGAALAPFASGGPFRSLAACAVTSAIGCGAALVASLGVRGTRNLAARLVAKLRPFVARAAAAPACDPSEAPASSSASPRVSRRVS